MKSLLVLLDVLLSEIGEQMSTTHSRDMVTCRERVKHEGISFLTITLPSFAKGLERALELRKVSPDLFPAFKRGRGSLPAFLQGLTEKVFDLRTGELLDEASDSAIFFLRQVSCLFKKISIPCTPERTAQAMQGYALLDSLLRDLRLDHRCPTFVRFGQISDRLIPELFGGFSVWNLKPKHGPGATAQKLSNNQKFNDYAWPIRLGRSFPPDWFRFYNLNHWEEEGNRLEEQAPRDEMPVRVISVPKTLKTPRIIAIEPVCMQYTQQSLADYLVSRIESHPLTRGLINFTDQGINANLALTSSKDRKWGTLDLSEASDRVHSKLVWRMLKSVPDLRDAVFACRSTRASVPGVGVIPLTKFASMGSALCFPVESMVFYIIAACAALDSAGTDRVPRSYRNKIRDIRVYGDDIIVPVDVVESTMRWLEALGLKVNENKTFYRGNFRESCGVDAFNGHDVTPCYMRELLPSSISEVSGIVSTVSLSNQMFLKGMWKTSTYLKRLVEEITGALPVSRKPIAGLHFTTFSGFSGLRRWNKQHQSYDCRTFVVVPKRKSDALDGWNALLKHATIRSRRPLSGDTFRSRVVPGTKIKSRWVSTR